MQKLMFIALAAFLGAMAVALLGWFESTDPFNLRKFGASVIRGLIGGALVAAAYNYAEVGPTSYFTAFFAGAGIDAGGKRLFASLMALYRKD